MKILFLSTINLYFILNKMGIVVRKEIRQTQDVEFTTINCEHSMENGMQMEYKKEEFKPMSIRPSTGAGLGEKIKRKVQSAGSYIGGGNHVRYKRQSTKKYDHW